MKSFVFVVVVIVTCFEIPFSRCVIGCLHQFVFYGIVTDFSFFLCTTEIKTEQDLLPPGAKPGTVPTDFEQATGLERLELIGKMQGIDVFDMKPLDSSRKGAFLFFCP